MAEKTGNFLQTYQPSMKSMIWSFIAGIVLTLAVGFMGLNWHTDGSANEMARTAATGAEAELASSICVERFMNSPDSAGNLVELKAARSWDRGKMIEKGGWLKLSQFDQTVPGAATLCANKLAELDKADS